MCEYFARQGVRSQPVELAAELWTAYRYRQVQEVHPALLDVDDARDRRFWEKQQKESGM